jgi:long-chain acyl-CoA synthetase
MHHPWLEHYPEGVPASVDTGQCHTLVALIEDSFARFADRPAYRFMGRSLTYAEVDRLSMAFACWLQGEGIQPGDRVALMMPNVPQYPVAVAGVLRAGGVVVNVNPLYTPRELEHQLRDAEVRVLVVLENFAHTVAKVVPSVPIEKIVLTGLGDLLGFPKSAVVNLAVRHVKKMVPPYSLPGAVRFNDALAAGRPQRLRPPSVGPDDIAVLQYTGGTTGVSKGAVLLHRNLTANVLQCEAWYRPALKRIPEGEQVMTVCALPLYHIFGFNTNMMLGLRTGGCNLLIPNPRDLPAMFKTLSEVRFHSFPAVNTLFRAIARHPLADTIDWSALRISIGGGMAVQRDTAELWQRKTGCSIVEGYGLSETSPCASCNPADGRPWSGGIGLPLPGTEMKLVDDQGVDVPPGMPGEIAIRGPQVMAGYWRRADETARTMTADGFFLTGDIGTVDERGHFTLIDRKKDMILVNGFNVYPTEIEDVVTLLPGVAECAVVGVPDAATGEAVKLVIVRANDALTEDEVRAHCRAQLSGYKRPTLIEFRSELPKTPVGKILRRAVREPSAPDVVR